MQIKYQNLLLKMLTIVINQAEFFAYHGFYPEEQVLGGRFWVDVSVKFDHSFTIDDELSNTVNYEQLYAIVSGEMQISRKLIETVVRAIADSIITKFAFLKEVKVCLKKLNPPLGGATGYTSAEVYYHF